MRRGFLAGIAIALVVASGVFFAAGFSSAHGSDTGNGSVASGASSTSDASESAWRTAWESALESVWKQPASSNQPTTSASTFTSNNSSSSSSSNSTTSSNTRTSTSSTTTTSAPSTAGVYAALGDSVAAGLGLPKSSTPSARDTQCGRSLQAYPYQVAGQLNKPILHIACSGATAGDLFTKQGVSGPNITSQLGQAYANGKPSLITITAGANDAQWVRFIQKCYASTCGTSFDTTVANGALALLQTKLYYAFYDIQARSGGSPPPVILTGYYNPFSSQCSTQQQRITAAEIAWIQADVVALNQTIKNVVAKFSFAKFAAVDFSGHDVCSADSWVQGQTDPAPIHPTAAGQAAIGQSVLRTISQ